MYVVIAGVASTALLLGAWTTVEPETRGPLAGPVGVLSYAVNLLVASYVAGLLALAVACCVLRLRRPRAEGARR